MSGSSGMQEVNLEQELQAGTGYPSYIAYLESVHGQDPALADVVIMLRALAMPITEPNSTNHCFVMDVTRGRKATLQFAPRSDNSSFAANFRDSRHAILLKLLQILKTPLESNSVRLVNWYIETSELDVHLLDVIGLGLRLPPSFLLAALNRSENRNPRGDLAPPETRFSYPEHHVIGNSVATFIQSGTPNVPTVLIANSYQCKNSFKSADHLRVLELLDLEAQRRSLTNLQTAGEPAAYETPSERICRRFNLHYQNILSDVSEQGSEASSDRTRFYISLCPLFKLASVYLQSDYRETLSWLSTLRYENGRVDSRETDESRIHTRNITYTALDMTRYDLRRAYEDLESSQQTFKNYIDSNDDTDWLSVKSYRKAMAEVDRTIIFARRLEAEVRDYMQLVVGALSIAESRKSIELSSSQIQEGQKVTILAFVYVPLNLATSIFGMNLQQLNENGQPLWVFLTTAVIATALTASIWFCIDQTNSVRRWKSQIDTSNITEIFERPPSYSLGVRFAMILYLVQSGRIKWMWESNVWLHVLINSKKCGISIEEDLEPHESWFPTQAGHCVSEIVMNPGLFDLHVRRIKW